MTPPFLFIRHGETDWNAEGRLQGQRDIPLNATGRHQATRAGERAASVLRAAGRDPATMQFLVSPLGRTRDTAERARLAMGLDPAAYTLEPRLIEFTFGEWEGSTWPEVKQRNPKGVEHRRRDKWGFAPPGGESYADLAARIAPWLPEITDDTVVVSHGGVARVLMVLIGGLSTVAAPNTEVVQGRVLRFADGSYAWR